MKKGASAISILAALFLSAGVARAQSIDDKIKALEKELLDLKDQQIEMKKEATSAAEAMPSFVYRPGSGLMIEAADKSWSFRAGFESQFRYLFEAGRDQVGRSQGELMGRRFRPDFHLCINNCLWEIDWRLDLDGFGTNTALQRGVINLNAGNISPWLPTVHFGMDSSNSGPASLSRQGSGNVGAQAEYDLFTRNQGFNTGSASYGLNLTWDDKPLSSIGIPGRIGRFQVGMAAFGEGGDGTQLNTDRKDFNLYLSLMPMSQVKNKWLSGFTFEYGAWFCNSDNRALANGCNRLRIQDHGDGGRQTLFDTGANSVGDGLTVQHGPGLVWSVGPYTLRAMTVFETYGDRGGGISNFAGLPTSIGPGHKRGRVWLIGHDLYLWSPKGFLTGSATEPGSVLVGTHFERTDVSCGDRSRSCRTTSATNGASQAINGGEFHRDAILLREWDLWYVIAPRLNAGINILWYDASNLRTGQNQAAHNLGICNTPNVTNATGCRTGIGGDWVDVFLNLRWLF